VQRAAAHGRRAPLSRCHLVVKNEMAPELRQKMEKLVTDNKIVVFMKGNRQFPQCGFSNTVVQILNTTNAPYHTVNILENDDVRSGMKEYSQWPTFPQVYIDGEFFGGCDIMMESYQSGELTETLEKVMME
jgi:monothiol glutaredoxin